MPRHPEAQRIPDQESWQGKVGWKKVRCSCSGDFAGLYGPTLENHSCFYGTRYREFGVGEKLTCVNLAWHVRVG